MQQDENAKLKYTLRADVTKTCFYDPENNRSYARSTKWFMAMAAPHLFCRLTKAHLLMLDDWAPDRLAALHHRDLMEIVQERDGRGSTRITWPAAGFVDGYSSLLERDRA